MEVKLEDEIGVTEDDIAEFFLINGDSSIQEERMTYYQALLNLFQTVKSSKINCREWE